MASVYPHRNGWQASVTKGRNKKKNFKKKADADAWADKTAGHGRRSCDGGLGDCAQGNGGHPQHVRGYGKCAGAAGCLPIRLSAVPEGVDAFAAE